MADDCRHCFSRICFVSDGVCVRCRPGVQSGSESYGGLAEDALGDAYNSSRDSTLMMREVMNVNTQVHLVSKSTHTQDA